MTPEEAPKWLRGATSAGDPLAEAVRLVLDRLAEAEREIERLRTGVASEDEAVELAGVLAQAWHDSRCGCGHPQVPDDRHYAMAVAAVAALRSP